MTTRHTRAAVIGASVAGLAAAAALADAFDEVVVVERDLLPHGPGHRKGTPQARHTHALLPAGLDALESLFPGLTRDITAAGVPAPDALGQCRFVFGGHRLVRSHAGASAVQPSRRLLESLLRDRLRATPGVTIIDACDVVGFVAGPGRIAGLRLLRRIDGSAEEVLDTHLVVDCSGRGTRTPGRLVELGYPAPEADSTTLSVGYVSCRYRLPRYALGGDQAVLVGAVAGRPRSGALFAVEDGEWTLTLGGMLGDHPPTDPDQLVGWAETLAAPDIAEALRAGTRLDDPVSFRYPASRRQRYERVRSFPDGLIVMGDALASFNPLYGQGMSVAALEAVTLREMLASGRFTPRRFFLKTARIVDVAWDLALGADLAIPEVEGRRTPTVRFANRFVNRVQRAATHDPVVAARFIRVVGLLDPPSRLARPGLLSRVLVGAGRGEEG